MTAARSESEDVASCESDSRAMVGFPGLHTGYRIVGLAKTQFHGSGSGAQRAKPLIILPYQPAAPISLPGLC